MCVAVFIYIITSKHDEFRIFLVQKWIITHWNIKNNVDLLKTIKVIRTWLEQNEYMYVCLCVNNYDNKSNNSKNNKWSSERETKWKAHHGNSNQNETERNHIFLEYFIGVAGCCCCCCYFVLCVLLRHFILQSSLWIPIYSILLYIECVSKIKIYACNRIVRGSKKKTNSRYSCRVVFVPWINEFFSGDNWLFFRVSTHILIHSLLLLLSVYLLTFTIFEFASIVCIVSILFNVLLVRLLNSLRSSEPKLHTENPKNSNAENAGQNWERFEYIQSEWNRLTSEYRYKVRSKQWFSVGHNESTCHTGHRQWHIEFGHSDDWQQNNWNQNGHATVNDEQQ